MAHLTRKGRTAPRIVDQEAKALRLKMRRKKGVERGKYPSKTGGVPSQQKLAALQNR